MTSVEREIQSCLSCGRPLCETGCPVGNHIRDFIKDLKDENIEQAGKVLRSVNPFPELTTNLCDCLSQCQGHCVKGIRGNSVEIQDIERYILQHTARKLKVGKACGKKAALIGAGPANLSAAVYFRENGWDTVIYEKEDRIGGAIYTGIPAYRFDKYLLENIYTDLKEAGVEFRFQTEVGKDIQLNELTSTYDAVLVGIGASEERRNGMEAKGYIGGLSLLYDLNILNKHDFYKTHYKKAYVWGGGNVAMDCARSLKRIIGDVTIVYRRSEAEMPAAVKEIEEAKKEGVQFLFLQNITSLITNDEDEVTGISLVKMELKEKDASGRPRPVVMKDSAYEAVCDLVVAAIGEDPNLRNVGELEKTDGFNTNIPHVYVLGDAKRGADTVAAAIKEGREAAFVAMQQSA